MIQIPNKFFYKSLLLLIFISFGFLSFAQRNFVCESESQIDQKLKAKPNNYLLLTAKAQCLFNRNEDASALDRLHLAKRHGGVYPAYLIAFYLETDGTFKTVNDPLRNSEIIDPTIEAYGETLSAIANIPNYPPDGQIGHIMYEKNLHLKIDSLYTISRLYLNRYAYQLFDHNSHLLQSSPSFEKVKEQLNLAFFPNVTHYMGPLYSLNQLQMAAQNCINTPYIKYWNKEKYNRYIEACKIHKNFVEEIRPLENERIQKSKQCKDLAVSKTKVCKEYGDMGREIMKKRAAAVEKMNVLDL